MGATLPVVARWVDATPRGVSWLGFFYAGNIAGAVFGCLLAGFYLLRLHDMATATYVAAAINGVVALLGFWLAAVTPYRPVPDRQIPVAPAAVAGDRAVYVTIALSGLCALGAEVVWTRLMALILGASVYTFSLILAVFLVGLGLGGGAGAALGRGKIGPRTALAWCQMLLAAAIAWTAYVIARCFPYWPIDPAVAQAPWFNFQIDLVRCVIVILPAAALWGASFPLALAAAARGQDPSRLVGRVYAANTLGAIIGAIGFSLLLIPAAGTQQAQRLLIGLSVAAALLALWPSRRAQGGGGPEPLAARRVPAAALLVAVVLAGGLAWSVPAVPTSLIAYGRYAPMHQDLRPLYVGEGRNASVAVTEAPDGVRFFHVSGKVEASTVKMDIQLQRMLGHVSALTAAQLHSVLVVGFGAGVTAGSFVTYPEVERIVICEIEPLVPQVVARYFSRENGDVVHDPRVQVVYDDARHYILTTDEKFDVITSDPIHPWVKGAATLYTKEYFEMAKRRLRPGGVVTQWVPLYESTPAVVRSEIATFLEVFPDGTLWSTGYNGLGHDLVLVGRTGQPGPIEVEQLQARLNRPDHARAEESLREVGFASAIELLATYTGQGSDLRPWLKGAAINRDASLRLQYLAGLGMNHYESTQIHNALLAYRRFPDGLFAASPATEQKLREAILRPRPADEKAEARGKSPGARGSGDPSVGADSRDAAAYNRRGYALAMAGQLPEAIASFQEALRLKPDDAETHANLGNVLLLAGRTAEAIGQYEEALRLKPDDAAIRENLAMARRAGR
jgi:spermidine synthase